MDQELGAATADGRNNQGYKWKNLFVKAPLVYLFNPTMAKNYVNSFDKVLADLDEIKTVDDAINSMNYFNELMLNKAFMTVSCIKMFNTMNNSKPS
jgi:hypothetical protein